MSSSSTRDPPNLQNPLKSYKILPTCLWQSSKLSNAHTLQNIYKTLQNDELRAECRANIAVAKMRLKNILNGEYAPRNLFFSKQTFGEFNLIRKTAEYSEILLISFLTNIFRLFFLAPWHLRSLVFCCNLN